MKRSIFGAAVLALALTASAAQAQRPVSFGIALGASMPSGDFSDGAEMGYHAMGTLAFSPPALPVGIRIDGMFNQFAGKTDPAAPGDFNFRVLALTANATFGMPMAASPISPYLIGGLGMYQTSVSCDGDACDNAPKDSNLGFNIGVGTKFALAGFGTFAEIRYHMIQDAGQDPTTGEKSSLNFIPITFGITF